MEGESQENRDAVREGWNDKEGLDWEDLTGVGGKQEVLVCNWAIEDQKGDQWEGTVW